MRYEIGRVLKLDEIDKTADTAAKISWQLLIHIRTA